MTTDEANKYIEFMNNPSNVHNCKECPENREFSSWPGNRLPYGQFNYWDSLHCKDTGKYHYSM